MVLGDILLNHMFNIQKNCLIFIVIYHFYLEVIKLKNIMSLFITSMTKKTMFSDNGFETSTKSRINTKESAQSNSV